MKAQFIEPKPELRLILVRAPDDPPLSDPEYQKELGDFYQTLKSQGAEVSGRCYALDAVGGGGGLSGEFTLMVASLAPIVTGAAAVAGAWLQAKLGRKVRVKFGDKEVEASTLKEVEKALHLVEESEQRTHRQV